MGCTWSDRMCVIKARPLPGPQVKLIYSCERPPRTWNAVSRHLLGPGASDAGKDRVGCGLLAVETQELPWIVLLKPCRTYHPKDIGGQCSGLRFIMIVNCCM